jgi:hypothetical protein
MRRNYLDYYCVKPDQSVIDIRRSARDSVGEYIFDDDSHMYKYLGRSPVTQEELKEIFDSLKRLNFKSKLPNWLQWGLVRQ